MTLDEFVNKYNGKYVDYDGAYGYQCVDLVRQCVKEVYELDPYVAIPTRGDAKNIFGNFYQNEYFIKVYNGKYNMPEKGDIVFWGYPMGFYWNKGLPKWAGHVAICTGSQMMQFISFDQNWGNPNFCRYVNHNYKGVLGWLHRK